MYADSYRGELAAHDESVARIVLQCLSDLAVPCDLMRLLAVVRGRESRFIVENDLHYNSMYGALGHISPSYLHTLVNALHAKGLIAQTPAASPTTHPTLAVTPEGQRFLAGEDDVSLAVTAGRQQQAVEDTVTQLVLKPEDAWLFEKMRQLRNDLARAHDMPPYEVCPDRVLRELARKRPRHTAALQAVAGVDDGFVTTFGRYFLDLLQDHARRHQGRNGRTLKAAESATGD